MYTVTYSHAVKLFAKCGEDWMKSVVLRREILKIAQKHGNSAATHARKVLPFSQTKSTLKITSAIRYQIWPKSVKNCAPYH